MFEVNANDVFVSAYSSGARVINLTNTHTNGVVLEKAFFDFIPTLNYNDASEYFYLMSGRDNQALGAYRHLPNLGMYFSGVYHTVPDFGTSRVGFNGTGTMLPDYKFVHAMAFGEGWIVDDPNVSPDHYAPDPQDVVNASGRNWLKDGGFIVLRYFDGKLGGTLSGYTGTNNWSDRSYRTINLQGPFSVDRDVTVAPGACVNLIPGHENDPGIFESTSLATSNGKVIYVDGVLQISVESGDAMGTDIVIDVPIIVRNNGKLIVHKIAPGKKVVFKKKVTIESGGEWKFTPNADVELYHSEHTMKGRFIVAGTNGNRVKITSRRNGETFSNTTGITGVCANDPSTSLLSIAYGDFMNVYTRLHNVYIAFGAPTVDQSTFTASVTGGQQVNDLLHIIRPLSIGYSPGPGVRPNANVIVTNSTFRDTYSASGVSPRLGLSVDDASIATIQSVTFDNLQRGLMSINVRRVSVLGCAFEDCNTGAHVTNSVANICNNTFVNNKHASVINGSGPSAHRDNSYAAMRYGAHLQSSGRQDFRNNIFTGYLRGINSWGTYANLRDLLVGQGLLYIQWGRNDFLGEAEYFPTSTLGTADIGIAKRAFARVDCGYNQFSAYSMWHINNEDPVVAAIDASFNMWPDGGGYQPRLNQITWTGTDLDEEEFVNDACGNVTSLPACEFTQGPSCPAPFLLEHNDLTISSPYIINAIDTARSQTFDSSIGLLCRRNAAWSYFGLALKADTVTIYNRLKADMVSIATNGSLDSSLRSTAQLIHATVLNVEEKFDSSLIVHGSLLTTFTTTIDSVSSNWEKLRIISRIDTTGSMDSLRKVYVDRVNYDLSRTDGSAGLAKTYDSRVSRDEHGSDATSRVMFDGDAYPNPISGATDITVPISASAAATCVIEITTMQGSVVSTQDVRVSKDARHLVINVSDLAAGTYLARLSCFGSTSTVQIVVHR